MKDLSAWLESTIRDFCAQSPENSLYGSSGEKAWGDPLVGFSGGTDPLYPTIQSDIGDFYMTPLEIFQKTFPEIAVSPDQLSVISWILPQTTATKSDHRKESTWPSERWSRSRHYGESFNVTLRRHLVAVLQSSGFEAVAPLLAPFWEWKTSERYGICSNWSERHAAHIAGLGTFGLCDGLITPVGKAIRCGSVVARISVPPTPRPYTNHREYCLFFSHGTCGNCIKRCPVGALSEKGHDKNTCNAYLKVTSEYVKDRYGVETYACGLCQVGVPCESRIPPAKQQDAEDVS
jgi:epoxyqueuosine reductase QueG